jgi:hypothetical protein
MQKFVELSRRQFAALGAGLAAGVAISDAQEPSLLKTVDVCVYGATASGIMAAVAASREGCAVIVVEPSRWLGGMTGGGISRIDWGREEAVGDTARTILAYQPGRRESYDNAQYRDIFRTLVTKHGIDVVFEHRLNSVRRDGARIAEISFDYAPPDGFGCPPPEPKKREAVVIRAAVFIDCSYEGDVMAASGVGYTYGRESVDQYGESLAGVRPNLWVYDIDPYVRPGEPSSGLLPCIQDHEMPPLGAADKLSMGYCFRYKLDLSGKGLPIEPTEAYDPAQFEVYRRGLAQGIDLQRSRKMPRLGEIVEGNGHLYKEGQGNTYRALLTTTVFGSNAEYPDGNWETRARIWRFHQDFFRNLTHFLRTDSVVPDALKELALRASFQRGIFDETQGWPHQLYVREARRMVSDYVITQKDLEGKTDPERSVGLASYGVDDWPYATIAIDGKVALSGGEFSVLRLDEKHRGIYKIPYDAIIPRRSQCENLLVPVCCSASHIAMTSLRMEPVWMILGESAGTAAAIAAREIMSVQDIAYSKLREKLLALGQRLERPA